MKVEKDFEELFGLFNKHSVRYCLIGSYAVAFHAKPRYTKDLDLLVESSLENGRKIMRALKDFGFGNVGLSEKDFRTRKRIIQLGFEPLRIDLITSVQGLTFGRIWINKLAANYGREKIYVIGLGDLIKLKRTSRRLQDRADLEILREIRGKSINPPKRGGRRGRNQAKKSRRR